MIFTEPTKVKNLHLRTKNSVPGELKGQDDQHSPGNFVTLGCSKLVVAEPDRVFGNIFDQAPGFSVRFDRDVFCIA